MMTTVNPTLYRIVGFTGVNLNFLIYDSNIDFYGSMELPH